MSINDDWINKMGPIHTVKDYSTMREWGSGTGYHSDANTMQRKRSQTEAETSGTRRGSWVQKSFCVLHFLFVENRLQPPWFWAPKVKIKQLLIREGRAAKKQQCGLGAGPWFPPRDACSSISELFCRTKTPNKWKMSAFSTSEKLIRPPETRLKACRPAHTGTHPEALK